MKLKHLALIAALIFSLFLAACGGSDDAAETDTQQNGDETTEQASEETSEEAAEESANLVAGAPLQDGTYTLKETEADKNGWKVEMTITVEDGKIVESNFDYVNDEGLLKSEDEEYQQLMKDKSGIGPAEFVPALNEALVETQNPMDVEVVTGATGSWQTFRNYAQQLVQAAQKGDTTTIEINPNAPLQDGEYSLKELNPDAHGWSFFMNMTVAGGQITEVEWDYVNPEGTLKSEDEAYQERMAEKVNIGPKEFVPALAQDLIEKQNAKEVEVVAGATHSTYSFKTYAAQLINAAQKGDTTPIEVDNLVFE